MGSQRVGHDWATSLSFSLSLPRTRYYMWYLFIAQYWITYLFFWALVTLYNYKDKNTFLTGAFLIPMCFFVCVCFFFLLIVFIYLWLCWVFIAVWVFSSCGEWGLLGSCHAQPSHCGNLSYCRALALGHRFSSCDIWTYLLWNMWDLSRSGMEPMLPALAGGFFTTEPPRKPLRYLCLK